MLRLVASLKRNLKQRLRKQQKLQIAQLTEQGIPLDRTWKLCEQIMSHMDLHDYAGLPIVIIQRYLVRTPYRSIETYQNTLDSIYNSLKEEQKLDRGWSSFETQSLSVADFMISEDGFYLPSDNLVKFLAKAKQILELMSQAEGEELGVVGYNNRALIPFFVRLRDTLMDLYDLQFAL